MLFYNVVIKMIFVAVQHAMSCTILEDACVWQTLGSKLWCGRSDLIAFSMTDTSPLVWIAWKAGASCLVLPTREYETLMPPQILTQTQIIMVENQIYNKKLKCITLLSVSEVLFYLWWKKKKSYFGIKK